MLPALSKALEEALTLDRLDFIDTYLSYVFADAA